MNKIEQRDKNFAERVKRAIDRWVKSKDLQVKDKDHQELAEFITSAVSSCLQIPCSSSQSLLLDWDLETDGFKNPRITDNYWSSPEEALYPLDPETDEPVEEAVAHFVWPLPDIECIPEI